MKLNLKDRIVLGELLPREGNFVTLSRIDLLKKKIALTDEEIKKFNVNVSRDGVRWDNAGMEYFIEVEIGEIVEQAMKEKFDTLDKEKKLNCDQLGIYNKFMGK